MKRYSVYVLLLLQMLLLGCTKRQGSSSLEQAPASYALPEIPLVLTDSAEIAAYLVQHYWDRYDFTDTTLLQQNGFTEELFVNFIGLIQKNSTKIAASGINNMMKKAQSDRVVFAFFKTLCERYFYDPTSPARNDEYLIPALEVVVSSNSISEPEKIRTRFQLDSARKNRMGTIASNLKMVCIDGSSKSLFDFHSLHTLLFFYNPECQTCNETRLTMLRSSTLTKLVSQDELKILAIYTGDETQIWKKHRSNIPSNWINTSMAEGQTNTYDLKASPTLYLLDQNKTVVLKDATMEQIIAYLDK